MRIESVAASARTQVAPNLCGVDRTPARELFEIAGQAFVQPDRRSGLQSRCVDWLRERDRGCGGIAGTKSADHNINLTEF